MISTVTNYEKIATIFRCALMGSPEGTFGKAFKLDADTGWSYRIEVAGGPCVLIRTTAANLWEVQFKGMIGADSDLEEAARMALDAGQGVSVTRNYKVA